MNDSPIGLPCIIAVVAFGPTGERVILGNVPECIGKMGLTREPSCMASPLNASLALLGVLFMITAFKTEGFVNHDWERQRPYTSGLLRSAAR